VPPPETPMPEEPRWPAARGTSVWVNCACSLDGRLAFAGGVRARLSSPEDLARVQRLRAASDGILVGVGTVLKDDPSLRVHWEEVGGRRGSDPTRIVVDGSGRTPPGARVLDGTMPTLVATSERSRRTYPPAVRTVVEGASRVDLARLFERLPELGIRRLLVEGGAEILSSVLRGKLFHRLTVYYAPVVIGGSTAPPMVAGGETAGPGDLVPLALEGTVPMGEGYVATYRPRGTPEERPGGGGAVVTQKPVSSYPGAAVRPPGGAPAR
jgi:2,5-diamino-6-(ribosylamino)-4(3H)-pyrimidinone 5'-phosphate reductase